MTLRQRLIPGLPALLLPVMFAIAATAAPTKIPELGAEARLRRDANGIVHVSAQSEHDLILMQGWAHARDRLFQIDVLRRQASGTLAELLGAGALSSDVELRVIGLRRAADRSLPLLSAATRAALDAYAAGVNRYVESHPLPPEYGVLERSAFEPWSPVDSVVIAKLIAFALSFDLDIGPTQAFLAYSAAGAEHGFDGAALYFEDVQRTAPFDPAATVPDATAAPAAAGAGAADVVSGPGTGAVSAATLKLGRRYLERVRTIPAFRDALEPGRRRKGSNEWVVDGSLTESGRPLLANDPHLALSAPAIFYPIHLRAASAGFDAAGVGFAGTPFVVLGQNRFIAWGATTNPMDVTDTYREQIVVDPSSPSGLSTVHRGTNEPVIPLPQLFRYNRIGDGVTDGLVTAPPGGTVGGTFIPPAVLIVPRRNQGPILALDAAAGVAISVQYTGFSGTRELDAFRAWNLAGGLDDFTAGLRHFDVGSQNFTYVDVFGNIAYFASAEMPLREDLQAGFVAGAPPFFIRDGRGGNEWLPAADPSPGRAIPYRVLPVDEMPHLVNPPAGFLVNANNDPTGATRDNDALNQARPGGGIFYLGPGYDFGVRAGRITRRLEARLDAGPLTAADMAAIQADVVMPDARVFVPFIVAAHANPAARAAVGPAADRPRVAEAVGRLAAWDFSAPTGVAEGYDASDVDGTRLAPGEAEIDASVAATIYSVWRGRMIAGTVDAVLDPMGLPRPGDQRAMTALKNLFDRFAVDHGIGASGLDFFPVPGVADPATRRDVVILRSLIDTLDLLAGDAFRAAFGGSTSQDDYRWGRLHRVVLAHPIGGPFSTPPAGGAFPPGFGDLSGLPVDGGFAVVDRSDHAVRAADGDAFMFTDGAARRYVGGPGDPPDRIAARTSLPGGASGVLGSPFNVNLLARWLTNDTYPILQGPGEADPDRAELLAFTP